MNRWFFDSNFSNTQTQRFFDFDFFKISNICVNISVGWEFHFKIIVSSTYLKQAQNERTAWNQYHQNSPKLVTRNRICEEY